MSMTPGGQRLATAAEALYLANLLILPGVAFLVLLGLGWRSRPTDALAAAHMSQAVSASLWAGALLIGVNALILWIGGFSWVAWAIVIVWFTVCHATFVLLGVVGLVKAMNGQCWRFPVVGRALPDGCGRSGRWSPASLDRRPIRAIPSAPCGKGLQLGGGASAPVARSGPPNWPAPHARRSGALYVLFLRD